MKLIKMPSGVEKSVPLESLIPFQGELKALGKKDEKKLVASLKKEGLLMPFAVWGGHLLDGHGRRKALLKLQEEGYIIPPVPVLEIEAVSRAEAAEKLLALSSRYHKATSGGMATFLATEGLADLELGDYAVDLMPSVDRLDFGAQEAVKEEEDEETDVMADQVFKVVVPQEQVLDFLNSMRALGLVGKEEDS